MKWGVLWLAIAAVAASAAQSEQPPAKSSPAKQSGRASTAKKRAPGTYATLQTSMGTIVCELFEKQTPATVENFIGLAEGTKEWLDPRTKEPRVKTPFYNGTIFHRVYPKFMIQGGDPLENGKGGPGYKFNDEIVGSLRFDLPGRLAMANNAPNAAGSQFFITAVPTPHLDGRHTIFGTVVEGLDVVNRITAVPRDNHDKPRTPVKLVKVTIQRIKK
jgi:peptidyl-prolyl cis-trans isomerase A (cyclophilin A)